jgi:hypothetical protein
MRGLRYGARVEAFVGGVYVLGVIGRVKDGAVEVRLDDGRRQLFSVHALEHARFPIVKLAAS